MSDENMANNQPQEEQNPEPKIVNFKTAFPPDMGSYLVQLAEMENIPIDDLIISIVQTFIIRRERRVKCTNRIVELIKAINRKIDDVMFVRIIHGDVYYSYGISGFVEYAIQDDTRYQTIMSNPFKLDHDDVIYVFKDGYWLGNALGTMQSGYLEGNNGKGLKAIHKKRKRKKKRK